MGFLFDERYIHEFALFGWLHILILGLGAGSLVAMYYLRERLHDPVHRASIVYLRATPSTLARRLGQTDLSTRPSLTGKGVLEEIDAIYQQRDEPYLALASRVIDVDFLTPAQTAEMLVP